MLRRTCLHAWRWCMRLGSATERRAHQGSCGGSSGRAAPRRWRGWWSSGSRVAARRPRCGECGRFRRPAAQTPRRRPSPGPRRGVGRTSAARCRGIRSPRASTRTGPSRTRVRGGRRRSVEEWQGAARDAQGSSQTTVCAQHMGMPVSTALCGARCLHPVLVSDGPGTPRSCYRDTRRSPETEAVPHTGSCSHVGGVGDKLLPRSDRSKSL